MVSRLRERITLFGGTALLAVAIFAAIARRPFRRRDTGFQEAEDHVPPPPA
jgi:hypothetical protein